MSTGHRKMLATATTAVAAVAALQGTAVPANAAIHQCERSGSWIPYLLVRRGPGYGYDSIEAAYSRLYNGNEVGLSCWKLGDGAYDNPNYRYWMSIELPNSRWGYVNDWYLNTGNPDVWKQQIRQCP